MQCPSCSSQNTFGAVRCANCNASLSEDETVVIPPEELGQATVTHVGTTGGARNAGVAVDSLAPDSVLGGRYRILKMLGEGGMGAVYKARDLEVDRVVALKVIRPEYANRPEILARFKQELVLARQITHRNVIRIFDLGQGDGIRFITMEYVDGQDLYSLLRSGEELTLERKVKIAREICRALEAAHEQGVVHRDLKPQNIMVENNGRVLVMDFGIARSMEDTGLTHTGALIGTPAFMSPEQAKGEKLDIRSDLFSFGVIFYEMLTGKAPYVAETAVGLLLKRVQERPVAPIDLDHEIPEALSNVVLKSLVVDRDQRYQTATEIIRDLDGWLGDPATFRTVMTTLAAEQRLGKTQEGQIIVTPGMKMMAKSNAWKWVSISVALAVLVIGGVFLAMRLLQKPAAPHSPVTVVIADISNHTGDAIFDGTLEPMLKIALEGAGFISAYDRTQMRALGVQPIPTKLDELAARKIALGQGLGVIVSGSLDRQSNGYVLSLKASQAVTGNQIGVVEQSAPNKDQVLSAVTKVASSVRTALGDATSESAQRFAMETLSASSLESVHEYTVAMDAISNGKYEDARRSFSKAIDLDPNFGLAYTGLAGASRNMGQLQDAIKYIGQANQHIDRMTERERYRTRGFFYALTGDHQKCTEEYTELITRYSSDVAAHNNLAFCFTQLRNMPKAVEEMRRVVAILPKRALYRNNLALYMAYAGDFQGAEREARQVQQMAPAFPTGFNAVAFAQLGQGQIAAAVDTYRKLEKVSASDGASGLGDLALAEGRFSEAVKIFENGAAADIAANNLDRAADKFAALAFTQISRGQKGPATAAAEKALHNSKSVKIRFLAGRTFAAANETAKAKEQAASLAAELRPEPQAYAKLIEGEIALIAGDAPQALTAFKQAQGLLDTWIGRFDLGRAYLENKLFAEADSEFDRCIKRRGEVLTLFMDEVPTYGYFPPVYYYQGKVREGMKSSGFAESYRTYLSIRGKAGEDPLLGEVRSRVGK